ncbi:MAG: guanylate kinase [Desulfobacterales bacterium]
MTPEAPRRGRLFILSAPSGAGKTTLRRALLERLPDLAYSVSYTTRPPRATEVEGRDYHFVSREEFQEGIRRGRWAEWACVHGHYYGTSAEDLARELAAGKDVLLDIDVQGAACLVRRFPDSVTVFIEPPSLEELERRLRSRGTDSPEAIALRMRNAVREMAARERYRHVVVNDRLADAVDELVRILTARRK